MKDIEKNDVDISKLFNWGKEFELDLKSNGKLKVYVRLIGDAELGQARTQAIRHSAKLRKELKNKDSEKRLEYIPEMDEAQKEFIIELILTSSIGTYTRKAIKEIDIPLPVEPDSDNLEELEEYQALVDSYPARKEEEIKKYITNLIEADRKIFNTYDLNKLKIIYEDIIIAEACESEMYKKFTDYVTYLSVYKDKNYKIRLFKSFEEYENLHGFIKEQLNKFYNELDVPMDELKK